MKKATVLLLALIMIFSSFGVNASNFYQYKKITEVPASVYQEPYMDSQFSTVYAPWLKNLHLMNQAQVNRGDYGGEACQQIRAFAISPVNPDVMYFGTDTSGIFKTTNGGKNWHNVNNGYPGFYSQGILCDVLDENIVYYVAKKASVARSRDGGKTWEEIVPDKSNFASYQKLMAQDAAGNLFVAIPSGIFKLDRATDTVTCLYDKFKDATADKGIYFYDIEVSSDGQHIYVAATKNSKDETATPGLYTSHDGGKTWEIKGTDDTRVFSTCTIALHPEDPMRVFAGGTFTDKATGKAEKSYMLYETTDGGNTFTDKFLLTYENLEEGVSKTPKSFFHLTFGPLENGVYPLYMAGEQMTYNYVVSYDYGTTFRRVLTPEITRIREENANLRYGVGGSYTGWWCQHFAVDMKNPGRLLLSYLGPAIYQNGSVKTVSTGFSGASVTDIAVDSELRPFFVTVDVKAFVYESGSMKDGDHFTLNAIEINEGDNAAKKAHTFTRAVYDPNDDNHIVAFVSGNNATPDFTGVRQSFDKGKTFEPMDATTSQAKNTPKYGATFVLQYDNEDSNTIYTTYHTSHDNGKTWEENSMRIMAISKDCKKFLGMEGSGAAATFHISRDKGKTWEFAITPGYSNDFKGIFFDTTDDNYIWVGRTWSIHRFDLTTGAKEEFQQKLTYGAINCIEYNPEVPGHIIVLSSPGTSVTDKDFKIAETKDNGKTWQTIPGGWGGFLSSVSFVGGKAYIGGHQGLFEYDYKKFWKFLESKITVNLDDSEVSFSVMPEIKEGRTMVPMRELFEMLGATVNWDGETRTVTANKGRSSVKLQIGNLTVNMNGEEKQMEAAPYIINGRTMVPLRFASEALGIRVGWDAKSRTIYLKS